MSAPKIHPDSGQLVSSLKKCLKPYRAQIKANTTRSRRFAFVGLTKIAALDECAAHYNANHNRADDYLDRKLRKICRKHCRTDREESRQQLNHKRAKVSNTPLDLNLIHNQNDDLDFEDGTVSSESGLTNISRSSKGQNKQVNGFVPKVIGLSADNDVSSEKKNALPLYANNLNQTFKIPKKDSQSIDSIITHVTSLNKRPLQAFNHLNKYLADDQWGRDDVVALLQTIAKNMVAYNEFGGNFAEFNEITNKLKSLKHTENDFWDDLIFAVEKKKNDLRNSHVSQVTRYQLSLSLIRSPIQLIFRRLTTFWPICTTI